MQLYELIELQPVQGTPSRVIILIHGTFSPNASWTQVGSPLYSALRNNPLNGSSVCRFTWSGKNDAMARECAAVRLRQHLLTSAEKYPGTPHLLVAHSHGGNIALRAVSNNPKLRAVKIVCLSTPIIYSFPRIRSEAKAAMSLLWSLVMALLLPCVAYLAVSRPKMSGVLIWLLSLSSAALGYLIFLAGKRHLDWSLRLCGFSAVTQGINPAAVLFLRYPGDEASLALIAFQAIQYLTNRLMETQMAVAKWLLSRSIVSRWRGLYFLFLLWLALLLGLALLYPVHRLVEGNAPFSGSTLDLVVSVGPVALILIAGLVTMLLGVAQGYLALALAPFEMLVAVAPFGWRLAAASLWIELTVESAPIGEWNVATLLPSMGSTTMRHGQGYEEPAALERIVKFVKDLAEPAQTSP